MPTGHIINTPKFQALIYTLKARTDAGCCEENSLEENRAARAAAPGGQRYRNSPPALCPVTDARAPNCQVSACPMVHPPERIYNISTREGLL